MAYADMVYTDMADIAMAYTVMACNVSHETGLVMELLRHDGV